VASGTGIQIAIFYCVNASFVPQHRPLSSSDHLCTSLSFFRSTHASIEQLLGLTIYGHNQVAERPKRHDVHGWASFNDVDQKREDDVLSQEALASGQVTEKK
jgi:hypothetical protein